jgi:hypothetical protein
MGKGLKVAITVVYRYQPGVCAPIDAGKWVADNGKVGDYRYYFESLFWRFARGETRSRVILLCST